MIAQLALYLLTLVLLGVAIGLGLATSGIEVKPGQSPLLAQLVLFGPVIATYATVGAVLSARRPRNPIGWLFTIVGLSAIGNQVASGYGVLRQGMPDAALPYVLWIGERLFPVMFVSALLVLPLFPSGTARSRMARAAIALIALVGVFIELEGFSRPNLAGRPLTNPFFIAALAPLFELTAPLRDGPLFVGLLACVAAIVVTYRGGGLVERQQVKWLLVASFVAIAGAVMGNVGAARAQFLAIPGFMILIVGLGLIPVGVAIAILRYGLYDIDRLISRALVYGAVSAALIGTYAVAVLFLGRALQQLTLGNDIAVAASTILIAALFQPVRRRIQEAVDRRFFRRKYDAEKTIASFSARLRQEIDLDSIASELIAIARDAVQPVHSSLWLRERAK